MSFFFFRGVLGLAIRPSLTVCRSRFSFALTESVVADVDATSEENNILGETFLSTSEGSILAVAMADIFTNYSTLSQVGNQ